MDLNLYMIKFVSKCPICNLLDNNGETCFHTGKVVSVARNGNRDEETILIENAICSKNLIWIIDLLNNRSMSDNSDG